VQPTVKQSGDSVIYREILPNEKLQPLIYCYWELKTAKVLSESFTYRVVSDGCIDIFFQLDNPVENFIMGFCKHYTEFHLENLFHYVGVRFLPSVFPQIFKINAKELSNRFERLELIVPGTSRFIETSFSSKDEIHNIKRKFDSYFIRLFDKIEFTDDDRFFNALHIILKNSGVVNIESDLDTGLSPRQLRRYFEYYIGDTAKIFSQVVRFQNILKAKPSTQSLRENKLFFDMGYYDQAHFIKEFKNFYGVTPSRAFGR
jgi:hypothetical protein